MTRRELIDQFFSFYTDRGHAVIAQASLVPVADTSVLFTTAGMHPLIPYLLGDTHPDGTRLVNVQRSLRTTDIEGIGDATHGTLFEMLGHWSLGDYWKREAIEWSYRFVTEVLGFSKERIAVTIFEGDEAKGIGLDAEAKTIWESIGVTRIVPLGADNFWGPVHAAGPCGPTTEIFVYLGDGEPSSDSLPGGPKDREWVEIWNNVFMEYDKTADGTFVPLKQKNIDTGVGLERVLMTVNGQSSIYETDPYQPLVAAISSAELAHADRDVRIIADHIKAAVFLIADGVLPSNKDRGYVLRRLIRRAVRASRAVGFNAWPLAVEAVVGAYGEDYAHLLEAQAEIERIITQEVEQFSSSLERAIRELHKQLTRLPNPDLERAAEIVFLAFQSHSLPLEMGYEVLRDEGIVHNQPAFEAALDRRLAKHREISGAGQEKKFGGHGLILDTGELKAGSEEEVAKVLRLHTATHLVQAGLRHVLGEHVQQKGSDITPERLRFDFTHPEKLTPEQIAAVEAWVNDVVARDLPMQFVELPLEEAQRSGALHFFGHKYPSRVKVYFVGESLETAVSKEFCGGPHVERTGIIGTVKITKEQSAAAGVRRIKAIVGE
ncbi:alanine--tRNA ligase [Candidatus Berkelbacteria bacterium]|nr:alanine--tRNA ligase [Candidatus Berkelbacteria bacterium]